jgi:phage baseplate assembly protein W
MNTQELQDNTINAGVAFATNLRAYIDLQSGFNFDKQLERRLDALLKSKLGAVLLAVPQSADRYPVNSALPIVPTVSKAELTQKEVENLVGMDAETGKIIRGFRYFEQRLTDALSTPQFSQILLRERGGKIFDLIDTPQNNALYIFAATAELLRHPLSGVPDFVLRRVQILSASMDGKMGIEIWGYWLGKEVEVIV